MWLSILQRVLVSLWQPPRAHWHRAGRSYRVPTNLDHGGSVCWAISGMKVSLSGHLAGGCPNLRPMRTAFCGSGAKRDFHPEGTKAPPPPTAVNAQSWASSHMRWESVGATALGRKGASTTRSPLKRVTGAFGTQGSWELGPEEGSRKCPACPLSFRPAPPRTQHRAGVRLPQCKFLAAALGRIPALAAVCLCPPSAFVRRGLHKMAATALRHFVPEAGGREDGGDHCARLPCVAWTEPSAAPPSPGLGQAALDLAPADILAGRSGAPAPLPAPPGPRATPGSRAKRTGMLQTRAQSSCN